MATKKQIEANRRNSKKSTGPKTDEGKAKSAQNAVKHGLTSRNVLLPDEDRVAYMEFLADTMAELDPMGNMETLLARRACDVMWRLDRCGSIEAQLLVRAQVKLEAYGLGRDGTGEADWGAAFAGEQALTRLYRYESALQRNLDRTLKQLRQMQDRRRTAERLREAAITPADAEVWQQAAERTLQRQSQAHGVQAPEACAGVSGFYGGAALGDLVHDDINPAVVPPHAGGGIHMVRRAVAGPTRG